MLRPIVMTLALTSALLAVACEDPPGDPSVAEADKAELEIEIKCPANRLPIGLVELEQRVRDIADALGLDFRGKKLTFDMQQLTPGTAALTRPDLEQLDNPNELLILFNNNNVTVAQLSDLNFLTFVIAHELEHAAKLMAAGDTYRAAQVELLKVQIDFQAVNGDPEATELDKLEVYVELLEANVKFFGATPAEEERVFDKIETHREKLSAAGLLSGDGSQEVSDLNGVRTKQLERLGDRVEAIKAIEAAKKEELQKLKEQGQLDSDDRTEDQRAAAELFQRRVDRTAVLGDGACGFARAEFSVLQAHIALTSTDGAGELLLPLETVDVGLVDDVVVMGISGITCSAFTMVESVEPTAFVCNDNDPRDCDGRNELVFSPAESGVWCEEADKAVVAQLELTCFVDAQFTEELCHEVFVVS